MFTTINQSKMVNESYLNTGRAGGFRGVHEVKYSETLPSRRYCIRRTCKRLKTCLNRSGKLSQDTPILPQVVKLGHAPDKIQV